MSKSEPNKGIVLSTNNIGQKVYIVSCHQRSKGVGRHSIDKAFDSYMKALHYAKTNYVIFDDLNMRGYRPMESDEDAKRCITELVIE